ncbi:FG-GAP-like repeat-containing protein [Pseudoxanthomonas sp. UTMC 1351]|uniref:FG-GAP-like repeat-containing protein n=1 Tax=Pseudoxanthomonas sp. UTMC 1351 TaxID=2695853 RepID=UPI0034CD15F6
MKFRVGACALLVCLAGCSEKGPNTDFAELRGAAATKGATAQLPKLQLGRAAAKSIANAPDRGALVSYQNKGAPTKREGAFTFYPVAISEDHALKALVTGEMSMPMPDGSQVKLKYERHDESPDGNWTWIGRVVGGDPQQEAIVTFGEKAVFASIPQANGAPPLSIQTRNGALFAVQTDPSKVKSPNKGHNDMLVPAALAVREAAAAQVQTNAQVSQNAIAQNAPPTTANTVDVAIGYTAGYRAVYGSQSATTTRLIFLIQVGNQAYSNSSINGYLRLVSATEVAYTDGNANQTALHELTGSNGTSNVAIPASLTPLRTARDQNGADIAILVRDFQQPEHQGCGIAWLIGADQREIVPSDAQWAYAVVSDGDDTGSDGNSYYCAPETLVHEASHLMGSAHDVANSPNASGRYPYSYGYKTTNGNFFTVMAYGDENQTPYRVFSNPNLTTCGGNACGVANQADNARSLNQTIPVVTQFRAAVVPIAGWKLRSGEVNADGRQDLIFSNEDTYHVSYWLMNGLSVVQKSASRRTGAGDVLVATGDFNGDGRLDSAWVTAANDLWLWLGNGVDLASTYAKVARLGSGWNVAAAGDVDGDGRDDLVFVNPSPNRYTYWIMNGTTIVRQGSPKALGAGETLAASGDFNGDGRLDLVWKKNLDLWMWLGDGNNLSATYKKIATLGAGWEVKAAGDINANGRDDLFFVNPSPNRYTYWLMNGTTIVSQANPVSLGAGDTLATSGDFNGDRRLDLVWKTRTNDLWVWLGNGTNLSAQYAKIGNTDSIN